MCALALPMGGRRWLLWLRQQRRRLLRYRGPLARSWLYLLLRIYPRLDVDGLAICGLDGESCVQAAPCGMYCRQESTHSSIVPWLGVLVPLRGYILNHCTFFARSSYSLARARRDSLVSSPA